MRSFHEPELSRSDVTPRRPHLLVAIGHDADPRERDVVRALEQSGGFDLTVTPVHVPRPLSRVGLLERTYRVLDRLAFGRTTELDARANVVVDDRDLDAIVQERSPTAILDLTSTLTGGVRWRGIPVLHLSFHGLPAQRLIDAVRLPLGHRNGTAGVTVMVAGDSTRRALFVARCFLDHRSLARSVQMVVRKIPMIVLASMRRLDAHGERESIDALPAHPGALGAAVLLLRLARSVARQLLFRDQWIIDIHRHPAHPGAGAPRIRLRPDANAFWADPFLVPDETAVHVFLEELAFADRKGRILLISVDRNGRAADPVVVLDQPWHLSYPQVITWQDRLVMIPESSANRSVDLYHCVGFPQEWKFASTLINGLRLADATVIHWNGRWWMFAAHGHEGASMYDELHVFWADDLPGPWHAHALNPVKIDAGSARPAGAMFIEHGQLVRPTQDCRNRYGGGVSFQQVVVLDEDRFHETPIERPRDPDIPLNTSTHTYNAIDGFIATDVLESVARYRSALNRFLPARQQNRH